MDTIQKPSEMLETLQQLNAKVKTAALSDDERRLAHSQARSLMLALEDDGDALIRIHLTVFETVTLLVAGRMGLLSALMATDKPISASEPATQCQAEELLTSRVLRALGSSGSVGSEKVGDEIRYCANSITRLSTSERGQLHMQWFTETVAPMMYDLPEKLAQNGWKSITSPKHTLFSDARGKPGSDFFQLLSLEEVNSFMTFMPVYNMEVADWLDFYPIQERLIDGAKTDADAIFFVDVGSSAGHKADALRRAYPSLPGRIIIQDHEDVLKGAIPGLEKIAHDFMTPQPVKGARAYYFRHIMHDWGNEKNTIMLKHICEAMEPGYSRVLIHDWVLADQGASKLMTCMDMMLMSIFGGEERPLNRHREYIEAAGLRISNVYDIKDGRSESIIECERV